MSEIKNQKMPGRLIKPEHLKEWLHDGDEIALLDVREHGQYGEQHLFYAVNLPYSRLEADVARLVPNPSARVVLVDEYGADTAFKSAKRLDDIGYKNVHVLEGGINAWSAQGYTTFAGVNVPSKAFGELVEEIFHTPHISPEELARKQSNGENFVILDGRPFQEYQKMNIPGAVCCPNGELALYVDDLVADETTPIVINCAGRTRSIIGAQTLVNLGIKNPVYALENGTQGWMLADLQLEHGSSKAWRTTLPKKDLVVKKQRAQRLIDHYEIPVIDQEQLDRWLADESRTTFLCDIRDPEEVKGREVAGFQNCPGGQLIQATDQYVAVRNARLVLLDTDGVRAPVVASWLHMQGWTVYLLPVAASWQGVYKAPSISSERPALLNLVTPEEVAVIVKNNNKIIDLRSSAEFRKASVKGSVWSIRPTFEKTLASLGKPDSVLLIGNETAILELAAIDLKELGVKEIYGYTGKLERLEACQVAIEPSPAVPADNERIDYLFFVHDRHEGNKEAARQYLSWELGLVAQLDDQEKGAYRISG